MTSNKVSLLSNLKDTMIRGDFTLAKKLLVKLSKSKQLSNSDLIELSEGYQWLGEPTSAIRILGRPYSMAELKVLSSDALKVQLRIAYMYHFIGARYLALNTFLNIENLVEENEEHFNVFSPSFYTTRGTIYLGAYNFKAALSDFKRALSLTSEDKSMSDYIELYIADCYFGLERKSDAIELSSKIIDDLDENPLFQAISLQARGEYLLRSGEFSNADADFKRAFTLIEKLPPSSRETKDYAYLLRSLGATSYFLEDYTNSAKYLNEAFEILNHKNSQPIALIATLYWLELLPDSDLELSQRVASRAHYSFSPYSFLLGKMLKNSDREFLSSWFQDRYTPHSNNCWLIESDSIDAMVYSSISPFLVKEGIIRQIDLRAGVIFSDHELFKLTEVESKCLAAVIGAGSIGANEWSLADFVYRQEFIDITNGVERIKKIVKQLKKKNVLLTRKDNKYFFEFDHGVSVILPMDLQPVDSIEYLYRLNLTEKITSKNIQDIFSVSPATARRLISKCILDGTLIADKDHKFHYSLYDN